MINLPNSTIVNRFIPKEKLYSKTTVSTKLRELFVEEIEKIVWLHKISPTTLNVTAGEYGEMQVFEISLKKSEVNQQLLKHIDTFIPYPILFVLKKDGLVKLAISYKEFLSSKNTAMKVASLFETEWQEDVEIELKGRSVDEIYKNFLRQIAPNLDIHAEQDVKSAIEDNRVKERIIHQIDALNRAILHEPSVAKQQALARQRYSLEQQLEVRYTES